MDDPSPSPKEQNRNKRKISNDTKNHRKKCMQEHQTFISPNRLSLQLSAESNVCLYDTLLSCVPVMMFLCQRDFCMCRLGLYCPGLMVMSIRPSSRGCFEQEYGRKNPCFPVILRWSCYIYNPFSPAQGLGLFISGSSVSQTVGLTPLASQNLQLADGRYLCVCAHMSVFHFPTLYNDIIRCLSLISFASLENPD